MIRSSLSSSTRLATAHAAKPASDAEAEAATGFLLRFAYIERNALAHKRDAAADLCLAVIEAAANGVKKFEEV